MSHQRFHPSETCKGGFTLVELLVVIAIVGILIGMLLPAVQAAREAARRTQCANNLKQVGLALQSFHDSNRSLPPGWVGYDPATGQLDPEGERGWGWAARILPYLEQNNLISTYVHFDRPIEDPINEDARMTVLPVYRCPSDAPDSEIWDLREEDGDEQALGGGDDVIARLPLSNYVGVFGTEDIEDAPDDGDGPLFHNSHIMFRQITDGTSNSFIVGERSSGLGFSTWVGVVPEGEESMDRILSVCNVQPNSVEQEQAGEIDGYSSFHATGTIFLLADSSVHWVSEDISLSIYQALATIAGEEVFDR
jgi:prepilin-type N-terminal cleavage/methylation domain-containing protein